MPINWDPKKAAENRKKHRVSFEEALTALFDPSRRVVPDEIHSDDEARFVAIGR
jgi:uncharacterized DUF497 family protein